ncbi:MAG: metal-dependent transcriptional regulator [Chloroflexi bacterium]|nr:metal-dependent transcriptional regulator [Chloroflexota bacterium]
MENKHATLTAAMEDYLKAIYELQATTGTTTTTALATALNISAASATNMIKKLAELKLARHSPYRGVELTTAGEKIALEVVRHHRLIELFLHQALGIPWDEVHVEAHKLEHVLSDNLENHIADFLGDPTKDPHGDPIPSKAGIIADRERESLADGAPGARVTIQRVGAQDPARLRYLRELGIVPQARVNIVAHAPFEGPVRVRTEDGAEHALDRGLARQIWVAEKSRPKTRVHAPRKMIKGSRQ